MTENRITEFSTNGTHDNKAKKGPRKPAKAPVESGTTKQSTRKRNPSTGKQRLAKTKLILASSGGAVAVLVMILSIFHCTDAIKALTGSDGTLACLLAIGIDLGMVFAELASILGEDKELKDFCHKYILLAIILSVVLNITAFVLHGTHMILPMGLMILADILLGMVIPTLLYLMGRIIGCLTK